MCDADLRTTRGSLPVALPPGQLRPYYARVLVSYRHRGNVGAALRPESIGPNAGRIPPAVEVAHRGARSLDQQRSQVVIAALGDREHDRAPTARIVTRSPKSANRMISAASHSSCEPTNAPTIRHEKTKYTGILQIFSILSKPQLCER